MWSDSVLEDRLKLAEIKRETLNKSEEANTQLEELEANRKELEELRKELAAAKEKLDEPSGGLGWGTVAIVAMLALAALAAHGNGYLPFQAETV